MKVVMKQGPLTSKQGDGKREPRPYAINQHFPSQLGAAIDPLAAEEMRMGKGFTPAIGTTDGMGQGPGANREPAKKSGTQGEH
jgi:hypothetical protein